MFGREEALNFLRVCKRSKPEIVKLTMSAKWFRLIHQGIKKFEYRKKSSFYDSRFLQPKSKLKALEFYNARCFSQLAPRMLVEVEDLTIVDSVYEEYMTGDIVESPLPHYKIALGKIISVHNY